MITLEDALAMPYCQEPGCHSARTAYYSDAWSTGTSTFPPQRVGKNIWLSRPWPGWRGWRRWCRAHALINEGVCGGG